MPRKERVDPNRVMVSFRLPRELWSRFVEFATYYTPRSSNTELAEKALEEFLAKHQKKEGKR